MYKIEKIEREYIDYDQQIMLVIEYLKQFEASRQKELELEQQNRKTIGFKTPGKNED